LCSCYRKKKKKKKKKKRKIEKIPKGRQWQHGSGSTTMATPWQWQHGSGSSTTVAAPWQWQPDSNNMTRSVHDFFFLFFSPF
jgi:hypothetical protein